MGSLFEDLAIGVMERLPKNMLSRGVGAASSIPLPRPLQAWVNATYASLAEIDVEEAERPPSAYRTLNEFFTRRLRPTVRSARAATNEAVAPVDGRLSEFGTIDEGTLIQTKGVRYSVLDLLDSWEHAQPFQAGAYATFYLSPRDYHRIHSPASGRITEVSYIPGQLFPVFPFAVENVEGLFTINERVVSFLEGEARGEIAVVKVGAACVGRIELTFHPLQTNQPYQTRRVVRLDSPAEVEAGDELGVFHLGSTVILLISDEEFLFEEGLYEGKKIEMGASIGRWPL